MINNFETAPTLHWMHPPKLRMLDSLLRSFVWSNGLNFCRVVPVFSASNYVWRYRFHFSDSKLWAKFSGDIEGPTRPSFALLRTGMKYRCLFQHKKFGLWKLTSHGSYYLIEWNAHLLKTGSVEVIPGYTTWLALGICRTYWRCVRTSRDFFRHWVVAYFYLSNLFAHFVF